MTNFTPKLIVQKNLEDYNNRDIEGFMSAFSEGIELYSFPNSEPSTIGLEAVRQMYQSLFEQSPKLHSTILKRIVFDNKVIDHESIKGRMGNEENIEMVLIYEVELNKISKITAIKK